MNLYYFMYYISYRTLERTGNYDLSFGAILPLATSELLYTMAILNFFDLLDGFTKSQYRLVAIIVVAIIFLLNYFVFLYKDRYRKIFTRFQNISPAKKYFGASIVYLFILFSFIIPFLV